MYSDDVAEFSVLVGAGADGEEGLDVSHIGPVLLES